MTQSGLIGSFPSLSSWKLEGLEVCSYPLNPARISRICFDQFDERFGFTRFFAGWETVTQNGLIGSFPSLSSWKLEGLEVCSYPLHPARISRICFDQFGERFGFTRFFAGWETVTQSGLIGSFLSLSSWKLEGLDVCSYPLHPARISRAFPLTPTRLEDDWALFR